MATITARLTLTGTGATSDVLSIDKVKALTVTNPTVQVGTVSLTTTLATTIAALNGTENAGTDTYLYMLNSSTGTETIEVQPLTTSTGTCAECVITQGKLAVLRPGEFALLPVMAKSHLQFKGSVSTAIMEYGYWTRSI